MRATWLAALTLPLLAVQLVEAGHADMFSCRSGKNCPITELTDANWDTKLLEGHFVMFYAPWCGHCRQLAPKLKKAAKALQDVGIKVGAVDVEPNSKVQAKFPDIRGFPTLKFVGSPDGKKAADYNGPREEDAIVEWSKQQAKKMGVTVGEAVATKSNAELYTFFGRAALDNLSALLVVGGATPPAWLGKVATELRKDTSTKDGPKPEARTRELVQEAMRATKVTVVKEGLESVLSALDAHERGGGSLGPPVVSPAWTGDADAAAAFGVAATGKPTLILAAVDRKTGAGTYVTFPQPLSDKTKPGAVLPWLRDHLPHTSSPAALQAYADVATALPAFPKPPNVLAAEARAQAAKAAQGNIADVADAATLQERCYGLEGKTCALLVVQGGADAAMADETFTALAQKYSRERFAFAAVNQASAPASFLAAMFGEGAAADAPSLAVVKAGKRPRVARATGTDAFELLLDSVVGGGAKFDKLSSGLPEWPEVDAA